MAATFDMVRRLGSGYFGEVWLAKETGLDKEIALKTIPPHMAVNPQNIFQEPQALAAAPHKNIVQVYETGTMDDGSLYISMEYLSKGSLEDEASGAYVDLTRAKRLMSDVLRGLNHLHENGVLHRDIKPANIMVGNANEGKLSDFGLATQIGKKPSSIGTKNYNHVRHLAPEVWNGADYDERSDVYAAGMTFYRLINGDVYLPPTNPATLKMDITEGKFPDRKKYRAFITQSIKRVVNKALSTDPAKRYESADAMRRDVEQLSINMNWHEKSLSNGTQWSGVSKHKTYLVSLTQGSSGYDVETRKGNSKKDAKRILANCKYKIGKSEAEKFTARILQNYVLGRF